MPFQSPIASPCPAGSPNGTRTIRLLIATWLIALAFPATHALAAQPRVGLGTADGFAVLAGSAVTNTGPTTVNGDLGVSPGTAVTGWPPGTVNGSVYVADGVANQAKSDLGIAYDDAAGRSPALPVPADLGGLTLTSGVYTNASALQLTGTVTLDAQDDPAAVFIFQAGSSLTTASDSRVQLINGAQPCNVYWQVGSSATLGTASTFAGNVLALTSISLNDNVTVAGSLLARNGAVTTINDTITDAPCAPVTATTTPGTTTTPGGTTMPGGTLTPGATTPGTGTGGGPSGGAVPGTGPTGPGVTREVPRPRGNGTAILTTTPRKVARTVARFGITRCVDPSFRAVVSGLRIRRVVFSMGGRRIAALRRSPFKVLVGASRGIHTLKARVTFTDATPAVTLRMRFRACGSAAVRVRSGAPTQPSAPPAFTG